MRLQQRARLRAHALGVGEVAGVVVGDDQVDRVAGGLGLVLGQQLVDVADLGREGGRPLAPFGIVAEQVAVVLHGRAAAGDVDDDGVAALEGRDRLARLVARVDPGVQLQRAAAARAASGAHTSKPSAASTPTVTALTLPKNTRCTQPCRKPDAPALGALGRRELGQRHALRARRRELAHRLQAREAPEEARRGAGQRGEGGDPLHPLGVGEEREDRLAAQALAARARPAALDLPARVLDELVVLHARRARGHARHAAQAVVPRVDLREGHGPVLLVAGAHEHDAPARGVHLLAPQHVRRARRQAEAAVHAVVDQLGLGRVQGVVRGHVSSSPGLRVS